MSKKIRYGDQVYIEISNNLAPPETETRLLCSNGFLEETVYGIKAPDLRTANFRNCIFIITPSLVDSKEDINILGSLRTELSFLSLHRPNSASEKYLANEINSKEKQIDAGKDNIAALNKKILEEMDGRKVHFGDVVLLQHLESGYFLSADSSYHPNNPTLNNVRLRRGRTPACYFKFFSYLSNSERTAIDYEGEIRVVSTYLNTVITMGALKNKTGSIEAAESTREGHAQDEDSQDFPSDMIRRGNILNSFEAEAFVVGTTIDSNENHRIKLVEYCSMEDQNAFKKKKVIKNGDYVRFQNDDFYLSVSKTPYRQNFGLVGQKVEGYNYNIINSIFQIINIGHETNYPKGNEIQSVPKSNDLQKEDKYYLKHLVTGEYLSNPQDQLFHTQDSNTKDIPVFSLINNQLKQKTALSKNSKVLLKAFVGKDDHGQFYREGDVESHLIEQVDLNSRYFVGYKNPEDKIKSELKLIMKSIIGNETGGSFFRINTVNEDDVRKVLEFESYANTLKNFANGFKIITKTEDKTALSNFGSEVAKIIYCTDKLMLLLTGHDAQAHILAREFRILDWIIKLMYSLVLSEDMKPLMDKKALDIDQVIQLLTNLSNITNHASKYDQLSHTYISQYIRVFIVCMLQDSPLYSYSDKKQVAKIKDIVLAILLKFLERIDVNTFGQLGFYEEELFANLDSQKDFSGHVIELLNHYSRIQCPYPDNFLKENFIKKYVGDPNKIKNIFPKISPAGGDDFHVEIKREGYPSDFLFSECGPEIQEYLNEVFKLISSIAKCRSLLFWNIIINYYSEELCESLLSSSKVSSKLKTNILSMVKSVHHAYDKLPFERIPSKIQMVLDQQIIDKWQTVFDSRINQAEDELIGSTELSLIKKSSHKKMYQSSGAGINKLSLEILKDGHEKIQKGNLESFPFVLQVMKSIVREGEDMVKSLWIIHDSLAIFFKKVAEELQTNEKRKYYYPLCVKHMEKILFILYEIDRNVTNLAFKEIVEHLKARKLKEYLSALETSTPQELQYLSSWESTQVSAIMKSKASLWKSKRKLYDFSDKPVAEIHLESCLLESLWKIVESGESELTVGIISLIKNKVAFEANLTRELCETAFLAEESEIADFDQLISSLLNLNRIERRLILDKEFNLKEKDDEALLDDIIDNLQKVFVSIYDFELHVAEENKYVSREKAQEIFLSRFRYSKVEAREELPFRHKSPCIKTFYQKIMRVLKGHEILLPFIYHLTYKSAFTNDYPQKFKLGYCLTMVILNIFMHKNPTNQTLMANYPEFINTFYIQKIKSSSIEASFMFIEMCRENKKLLKLDKSYLFTIVAFDFVRFYDRFTSAFDSPETINYIRSLPTIISTSIPTDIFNPTTFMMKTFFDFFNSVMSSDKISLQRLINDKSFYIKFGNTSKGNLAPIPKSPKMLDHEEKELDQNVINMPIFYTILKELMESQKIFALTDIKERVRILQTSFTLEKILPFLKNENIEFNFEIKQLVLQTLENLSFKNVHTNTNIFLDFEQFNSFVSVIFADAYGYLMTLLNKDDPIFEIFAPNSFSSPENLSAIAKYDKLLKIDLNNIAFLQYQSLVILTQVWKKYLCYALCDFFDNLLVNYKDFMLTNKEKDYVYSNTFETWLKLTLKLRELETDVKSRAQLDEALKRAMSHSEYAHRRELVYSTIEKGGKTIKAHQTTTLQQTDMNIKFERLVEKIFQDISKQGTSSEENLSTIVLELGLNKHVLKRLIELLSSSDAHKKDIIFILKLLRKVIEVENTTDENNLKPIYMWKDVSDLEYQNINYKQQILNELGIVSATFNLLYDCKGEKEFMKQILLVFISLLFGGNKSVQDSFYAEFADDTDNDILNSLVRILEDTLETLRMKEGQKTQNSYVSTLQFVFNFLSKNKELSFESPDGSVKIPEKLKFALAEDYNKTIQSANKTVSIETEEYNLLLVILEFLQTLCEGHYLNFQEFLRDQTIAEHSTTSNVPEFLRQAYHVYYKSININNIETGVKILDLLTEIQQGASRENVELLLKKTFISDLCNTLNGFNTNLDLLSRGFGFDSNHKNFMALKSRALIILKDLVERSDPESLKKISQYVDLKALVSTFKENVMTFHVKKKSVFPNKMNLKTEDLWEPSLASAFTVYFIFKHLSFEETTEDFIPEITQAVKDSNKADPDAEIINRYLYTFFKSYVGSIEIFDKRLNKLMKIYFPIPVIYSYLKPETKKEFSQKVDRSNTQTKIADLMDSTSEIVAQMYVEYGSRNRVLGINFNNAYSHIRLLTNLIAIGIFGLNLFGLEYVDGNVDYKTPEAGNVNDVLSGIQAVLGCILALLWLHTRLSRFLAFKWDAFVSANVKEQGPLSQSIKQKFGQKQQLTKEEGKAVLLLAGPYSEEWKYVRSFMQGELSFYNLRFTLQSGPFLWHILYSAICIGSIFHTLVTAFQLFDIIIRSDTVFRISLAISRNLSQFLWTLVLMLVTIYVYTLFGFYFLNDRFVDDDAGRYCQDAYSCYLASLNQGLRSGGGIADALKKVPYDSNQRGDYFLQTLFDLTFFIVVITLLLNLIFGMIIDAFGDLRDEKTNNDEDMQNVCFICGIPRSEYERTSNFEKHIADDHNLWKYVAYLVYIYEKERSARTDLTDVEDYVLDRYKKKDHVWLPVGRSLTLERHFIKEEKDKKSEIENLKDDIAYSFEQMFEQNKRMMAKMEEMSGDSNQTGIKQNNQMKKQGFLSPTHR